MKTLAKFAPTLTNIAFALIALNSGDIQRYIADHPEVAIILASLSGIITHLMPSPMTVKK